MAALLAVMCMFTSVNVTAFAATGIGTNNSGVWEVTAGQLAASRYDGDEADVITSPAIDQGETFAAKVPTEADDLVSVSTAGTACTVTAEDYEADGQIWKPVYVEVKDTETDEVLASTEDWTSSEGVNTAEVTLPADTASYYASVVYAWEVAMDEDEEDRLLNVPRQLVDAKQVMDIVVELEYDLETLSNVLATVQSEIDDLPIQPDAVKKLSEKIAAAEESTDALLAWIADYEDAEFKAAYHWENGADIKADAEQAWYDIDSLYQNVVENEDTLAQFMGAAVIGSFVSVLENLVYEDPANESDDGYLTNVKNADWSFLAFDPGFTGEVDTYLDFLVEEMDVVETATLRGNYTVASEVIAYEVNVTRINVTLKAQIGSEEGIEFDDPTDAEYYDLEDLTATILLPMGTTKDVVMAKIDAKVAELVNGWDYAEAIANPEYFTASAEGIIPDVLGEDDKNIDWTVTYTPNMFEVTFVGDSTVTKQYPYRTFINLSEHTDLEQSWDYTVNGVLYEQGYELLLSEDLIIARQKLPAIKEYRISDVLAADTNYPLNANEKAILSSPALISDSYGYRLPSSAVATIDLDEDSQKYIVTASTASAGVNVNGEWVPVRVDIMNGSNRVGFADFNDGVAEWYATAYNFTNVNVVYDYDADIDAIDYLNLPYEMKQNVIIQKELLISDDQNDWTAEKIYGYFSDEVLEVLTKERLGALKMMLGREAQAAVQEILDYGWSDVADEPAVYSNLKAAESHSWSFSKCVEKGYYANICEQVDLFARNLDAIVNDSNFNSMLEIAGYEAKQEQIDDLREALFKLDQRIKDNPLHENFDQDNGSFAALIDIIDKAEDLRAYSAGEDKGVVAHTKVLLAKPGSMTLTITVFAEKQANVYASKVESIVVEKGEEISAQRIKSEIAAMESELGLTAAVKKFYTESEIDGFAGGAMLTDNITEKTWTLNEYVVKVEGTDDKILRYGDKLFVDLPQSEDPNYSYKYFVDGVEITDPSGKYWFENEDLLNFENGEFVITREVIDKKVQTFEKFIDTMNSSLSSLKDSTGKPMASFVPVKNAEGDYESIVLKLSASQDMDMAETMIAVATAFTSLSYNYIGLEDSLGRDYAFKYEEDGMAKLNPQALIDLFLNGGISTESLLQMINADGSVNGMTLPGYNGYLGGQLIDSTLYLGNAADDCEGYNFYITLNPADKALLKDLRALLVRSEQVGGFAMNGGAMEIEATIPETAYKLYLSTMLLFDRVDLDTMEDRELVDEVEEIKNILEALLVDTDTPVTAKMLQDTLNKKMGLGVDLMSYSNYIDMMLTSLKNSLEKKEEGELLFIGGKGSGASYNFSMQYDMNSALSATGMDLGSMLSDLFTTTKLTIPVYINVWNYGSDFTYEALVIDVRGEGLTGKMDYVEDLSAALASATGPVYAILLKDINDDITVNCATILDLNGKTINGDVKANAALRIVSRILDIETAGGVTGDVTGNVVVTAGTFADDLGSKVKSGYEQNAETGTVKNTFYNVQDTEEEMTITIDLSQIMAEANGDNLPTVALEMVSDIFLNLDSYASVKVDGDTLYEVDFDIIEAVADANNGDFMGIADQILDTASLDELKDLANNIASDLTDVKKIAKVLKDGGELSSYTYEVAPWYINPSVENGSIKVAIGAGTVKTKTVTIEIAPLNAEQKETLKKLYAAIDEIVAVTNRAFDLGTISYADGGLKWTGKATATVTMDLSSSDEQASDYVTALSIILANNSKDKAKFVRDIKLYHNNEWSKNLEARYNALTIGELVEAVNAVNGKFLDQMIAEVGLTGELEDVEEMTSAYDAVLYVSSNLAAAIERLAGNTAFFDKPVNGLYDGETASYSSVSLTVALKLFNNKYASKAQEVIDMINSLPDEFDAENFDAFMASGKDSSMSDMELLKLIDAIETAFAALSADAQEIVKANCDYGTVERVRIYLMTDHRAARVVARMIDGLPHMFSDSEYAAFLASGKTLEECECCELKTEEVRAAVIAAREAFDALGRQLGAAEQEWVKANCDFSKLINGEDYFGRIDAADLIALLQAIAAYNLKLDDLDIFSAIYYDQVAADVATARALYDGLSAEAKATIPAELLAVLTNAEAYFAKWTPILQNVINLIEALPEVPSEADYEAFMDAKAAFEALYPNSQAYVMAHCNFAKYEAAAEFFQVDILAELKAKIDALPAQFTKADYADHFCVNFDEAWQLVIDADKIWDELGVDNNDLYLNDLGEARINKLNNARRYFSDTAVLDVIALIKALPNEFNVDYYEEFLARGGKLRDDIEEVLYATVDANDAYLDLVTAYVTDGAKAKLYIEGKYEVYQKLLNALDYFADRIGLWIAEIDDSNIYYTGAAHKPQVRVYEGAVRLQEKVDYTVAYRSNIKAFELSDYEAAHEATEAYRAEANADGVLDKEEQKQLKALEKTEKTLMNKIPAVVVNFKKNYKGSAYRYFNINRISLTEAFNNEDYREMVGLTIETDVYTTAAKTAKAIAPVITLNGKKVSASEFDIKLVDYTYEEIAKGTPMNAGDHFYVMVSAKEGKNFEGLYTAVQHVDSVLMNKASIAKIASQVYTGEEITPAVTVTYKGETLVANQDYVVEYSDNVNAGTAKVTVIGVEGSGFTGTKTATFSITGTKLASKMLTMPKVTRMYNGDAQLLVNGVDYTFVKANNELMVEGEDYVVTYSKNVSKGTASATFIGIGNYSGTIKKTFTIKAANLNEVLFDAGSSYDIDSVVFTKGGAVANDQVVLSYNGIKLIEGKDYTISYKNNKTVYSTAAYEAAVKEAEDFAASIGSNPTSAQKNQLKNLEKVAANLMKKAPTLTVKGKGNYAGTLTDLFDIEKANFAVINGTAKSVQWKDKAGNFKTSYDLLDLDGKRLAVNDHKSTYGYYYDADPTEGENWVEIDQSNKKAQVPASAYVNGYVDMMIKVTASETSNYYGDTYLHYHLYTTAISKAKIDRNTKYKFIYNRAEQKFVGEVDGAGMKLWADNNKTKLLVEGEDYEVSYMKNIFAGSAIAEVIGLNEYGATKKISFKIEKNGEAVSNLDNRVHYFDQINVDQMLNDNLVIYEATALFEF